MASKFRVRDAGKETRNFYFSNLYLFLTLRDMTCTFTENAVDFMPRLKKSNFILFCVAFSPDSVLFELLTT